MGIYNILKNTYVYSKYNIWICRFKMYRFYVGIYYIYRWILIKDCSIPEHNNFYSDEKLFDDSVNLALMNFKTYYFNVHKTTDITNDNYVETAVEEYFNGEIDYVDEYDEDCIYIF